MGAGADGGDVRFKYAYAPPAPIPAPIANPKAMWRNLRRDSGAAHGWIQPFVCSGAHPACDGVQQQQARATRLMSSIVC